MLPLDNRGRIRTDPTRARHDDTPESTAATALGAWCLTIRKDDTAGLIVQEVRPGSIGGGGPWGYGTSTTEVFR